MKTGYILSVLDKQAGDKAFKVVLGDRKTADARKLKIQENYKGSEEEFSVITESQYSEATAEDFSKLLIHPEEDFKVGNFHSYCDSLDYVLSGWNLSSWKVEVYKDDFDKMLSVLIQHNIKHSIPITA